MDAPFTLKGLADELGALLESQDFEGAEELLHRALTSRPELSPFLHFQLGRVYVQWNKMSSALLHLGQAAEMAQLKQDEMLLFQILEEFRKAKSFQLAQRP